MVGFLLASCTPSVSSEFYKAGESGQSATEIPAALSIWLPPYLPAPLVESFSKPDELVIAQSEQNADIRIDVGSDAIISEWVYALAAPFSTIPDGITAHDLNLFWKGDGRDDLPFEKIILNGKTKILFEKLWGVASLSKVIVVSDDELLGKAWIDDKTWAIIPFEILEPHWKVIRIDGQSPLDKPLSLDRYPLVIPFSVFGSIEDSARVLQISHSSEELLFPKSNRDEQKLAKVMLTGVTALVRATAYLMEKNGMSYPAIEIGDLLRSADILHISNEIPFTKTCPNPFYNKTNESNLVFCSKPEYVELLEAVGTDVVELTGDHFRDWGPEPMLDTIDMYEERGWQYYGGGRNLEDAMKPALFNVNGNKIAFLGCNAKPPGYATAKENYPGALHCDMQAMRTVIKEVVAAGYQPIFTFQHLEYYAYYINQNLVNDFQAAAEAGAVIVSGSQAHQPHAFEFYKNSLLHYGLGNLFFDQYNESHAQRQAFIDVHYFYEGEYINTELVTIQFIDYARSRFATNEERESLLKIVFSASKW